MSYKIPTASVISSQFPEFVREDYPKFIRFVELYYKFLNESKIADIGSSFDSIRDVDVTLNKFVDSLWSEMGINVPRKDITDDIYFLKHIKEFYSSKGSEESFRVLFRHLFNTEIEIQYPKDYIFKTSAGNWNQDVSVVVNVAKGNILDIVGQQISIQTKKQLIKVSVNRIVSYGDSFEVFLDTFQTSLISVGDVLQYNGFTATIIESLISVTPYSAGANFNVGQIFDIPSISGSAARVKVNQVSATGGIIQTQLLNFGSGYLRSFYANVVSGYTANIATQNIYNDSTNGFIEKGYVSSIPYSDLSYCDSSYCGEIIAEFYSDTTSPVGTYIDDTNLAVLTVTVGAVRKYPGFYLDASGFTSDSYYLQDGNFYQLYSYVISCVEAINSYKDIVKTLVHPAGLKMFSNQVMSNNLSISNALSILGLHFQEVIHDRLWETDLEIYDMLKLVLDLVDTSDYDIYDLHKPLVDSAIVVDLKRKSSIKSLTDYISAYDLIPSFEYTKPFTDALETYCESTYWDHSYTSSIEDFYSGSLEKTIKDSVSMSDLSGPYCDVTYCDATYVFTMGEAYLSLLTKNIQDLVTLDDLLIIELTKGLSNSVDVIDTLTSYREIFEYYVDFVTILDSTLITLTANRVFEDLISISDSNITINSKIVTDSISATDTILIVLDNNRSVEDTILTTDLKGISNIKSLTDIVILGTTYWDSTYSDISYTQTTMDPVITYSNNTYSITLTN